MLKQCNTPAEAKEAARAAREWRRKMFEPRPEPIKKVVLPEPPRAPVVVRLPERPSNGNGITAIQEAVAQFYGLTRRDLLSRNRHREITFPRQVAMYLCRRLRAQASTNLIAKMFKGLDHTSVMYASDKIRDQLVWDRELQDEVEHIIAILNGG